MCSLAPMAPITIFSMMLTRACDELGRGSRSIWESSAGRLIDGAHLTRAHR